MALANPPGEPLVSIQKNSRKQQKNHKIMNTGNTYGIHVLDPNHLAEAGDYPVPFGSFNPFVGTEPVTMLDNICK